MRCLDGDRLELCLICLRSGLAHWYKHVALVARGYAVAWLGAGVVALDVALDFTA
jgi:hypothetical protein